MYFCQAQNLNCCQARWLLNLANFNLKIIHVPGCLLIRSNALFCHSDLHLDNLNSLSMVLLPNSFVSLIDTKIYEWISDLSNTDPLILQYLQSSLEDIHTVFCSHLSDWKYDDHILTYKGHVYIPPEDSLCCSILTQCHDYETAGHPRYLKTHQLITAEF